MCTKKNTGTDAGGDSRQVCVYVCIYIYICVYIYIFKHIYIGDRGADSGGDSRRV